MDSKACVAVVAFVIATIAHHIGERKLRGSIPGVVSVADALVASTIIVFALALGLAHGVKIFSNRSTLWLGLCQRFGAGLILTGLMWLSPIGSSNLADLPKSRPSYCNR